MGRRRGTTTWARWVFGDKPSTNQRQTQNRLAMKMKIQQRGDEGERKKMRWKKEEKREAEEKRENIFLMREEREVY